MTKVIAIANQKGAEPKRTRWVMKRGGSPVSHKQCERRRSSAPIANCPVGKTSTTIIDVPFMPFVISKRAWHINNINFLPFRSPLKRQPRNMAIIAPQIVAQ